MRAALIAATMAGALLAVAPGAAAVKPVDTFAGTCDAQVIVRNDPPMSSTIRDTNIDISTVWATCTGTVSRGNKVQHVDAAPTTGYLQGFGPSSCLISNTSGSGHFTIDDRWRIDFDYTEPRLGPLGTLRWTGAAGGTAMDAAHLSSEEDSFDVVQRCGGEGVPSVLVDVTIVTTPSISG
jgi:hypothetical protein